jgi:hypothetical protein
MDVHDYFFFFSFSSVSREQGNRIVVRLVSGERHLQLSGEEEKKQEDEERQAGDNCEPFLSLSIKLPTRNSNNRSTF